MSRHGHRVRNGAYDDKVKQPYSAVGGHYINDAGFMCIHAFYAIKINYSIDVCIVLSVNFLHPWEVNCPSNRIRWLAEYVAQIIGYNSHRLVRFTAIHTCNLS